MQTINQGKRILLVLFFLIADHSFSQTWNQINDFPAYERDDGTVFTIGNYSYCGTGMTPWWSILGDFYKFSHNHVQDHKYHYY
jgi:hypothetical protein